jgi:uncharacterized membrane protein
VGELRASHTVEIEAPIERVYEVAADIAHCDEWTPSVESVEVLERHPDGSARLVEMENDAFVKKTRTMISYEYDGPERMTWKQEQGDAKWLTGSWELTALDDGRTRAVYSLQTDPGRMLGLLLRGPVEGKAKEFLTKGAAEGLKEHVEASGS